MTTIDESGAPVAETKSVEWRGTTFTIPATIEDWPADAVEAFETEKAMQAIHLLLGEEQWEKLKTVSGRTVRDVSELFELTAKAAGFNSAGN